MGETESNREGANYTARSQLARRRPVIRGVPLARIHNSQEKDNMKSLIVPAILAAFTLPAMAQPSTPMVDQRQATQQQRIDQGVKSGTLTPKETAKLEKGQAKVQKIEDKAKADGKVTPKERTRLAKAQNKQSRKIYKEKHDNQKTPKAS
jgi:hypothetical protein